MVDIDAASLSTRELNQRIKELARSREAEIRVLNPQAGHNMAVAVLAPCRDYLRGQRGLLLLQPHGRPSRHCERQCRMGLGDNLMGGSVTVTKNAGASVASSIRGGEVTVHGNAGARAGISMKGGTLLVQGNTGFMTGFMMQKGKIIVCGDVGDAVGDSMYEGEIYVGGNVGSLGSDAKYDPITEDELIALWQTLEQHGIRGGLNSRR